MKPATPRRRIEHIRADVSMRGSLLELWGQILLLPDCDEEVSDEGMRSQNRPNVGTVGSG